MKYNLKSYIMSYVHEVLDESKMMSYVYDVIYDVMCIRHHVWCMISYMISSLIQPGSNAPPGRFKCGPWPVHMQSYLNQMLALLVPFVCLSVLASKSGCSGLLLHIWRLVLNSLAPSPLSPILIDLFTSLLLGACLSDFGARLYHSTSLRLSSPCCPPSSRPRQ